MIFRCQESHGISISFSMKCITSLLAHYNKKKNLCSSTFKVELVNAAYKYYKRNLQIRIYIETQKKVHCQIPLTLAHLFCEFFQLPSLPIRVLNLLQLLKSISVISQSEMRKCIASENSQNDSDDLTKFSSITRQSSTSENHFGDFTLYYASRHEQTDCVKKFTNDIDEPAKFSPFSSLFFHLYDLAKISSITKAIVALKSKLSTKTSLANASLAIIATAGTSR